MSAIDKLHKLYSSTLNPIVWARSVGLEVLNELDSVKAALMMDAGAGSLQRSGWDLLAGSIEGIARGVGTARVLGQGIGGIANGGISELARKLGGRFLG